jgi:hypothetical protein
MNTTPDNWCVIKFTHEGKTTYKVFAEWRGGYTTSDQWRMNSGIVRVTESENFYDFDGYSGSVYRCNKHSYGIRGLYAIGVFEDLKEKVVKAGAIVEVLSEDTNFLDIDWTADE